MRYEGTPEWDDVIPIPQDDGGPNPLAAIAYTEEYSEAMSYLRAVMAENENSERALKLTEHIISMNPAHYTVWLYRASIIKALEKDLLEELEWLNKVALRRSKNYQIWQHRQNIVEGISQLPANELEFLASVLEKDAKNYHVWSYRQWLVQRFELWPSILTTESADSEGSEIHFVEKLLDEDVYNNSAWNHRYFVLFGRDKVDLSYSIDPAQIPGAIWDRELAFAKNKIALAPQNVSSWNYLQGVQRKSARGLSDLEEFALQFSDPDRPEDVRSSHALDLIAETRAHANPASAKQALQLLADKFDPVRANYWKWRIDQIPSH